MGQHHDDGGLLASHALVGPDLRDPSLWLLVACVPTLLVLAIVSDATAVVIAAGIVVALVVVRVSLHAERANRAVRRSWADAAAAERRAAALLEHASDAVAVVDASGTIRHMSAPIAGILGWTAEEMVGRPSSDFVHPDDVDECTRVWREVLATPGATARVDIRHLTKDGAVRLIEGHFANRLHDPDLRGVVINERDVTERRAAEEALRRQAAHDEAINRLGRHALESVDPAILAQEATTYLHRTLGAETVTFARLLPDGTTLVVESTSGWSSGPAPACTTAVPSLEAVALRTGLPGTFVPGDPTCHPPATAVEVAGEPLAALAAPVEGRHGSHGVLVVHRQVDAPFTADEVAHLRAAASVLSLAVQRRAAEAEIRAQALHDALTGLPNRSLFVDRLGSALGRAARGGTSVGVVFLDLDRFKDVNDGYGHAVGDAVLVEVGRRLVASLRPGDTVARLGGDEFTVLLEQVDAAELDRLAARVGAAVAQPLDVDGHQVQVSASVGVRLAQGHEPAEVLLGDADAAMYVAKQRGRARVERFLPEMRARIVERLQVGKDLERAMRDGELHVAYQPIVDLRTGRTTALEALLRWDHPHRGTIPPARFIALAEESGHIHELGRWVLERALAEVVAWAGTDPGLTVAVNVSPCQLVDPSLPDVVADVLARTGIRADRVGLEITERAFEQDLDRMGSGLAALRALGVTTAIDDFGTGYSSIAYLKQLPVDVLKLDADFVRTLATSREDRAIAEAVAAFGRSLGLVTVAEGVEDEQQAQTIRAMGFDRAQGHLYSRAVPLEQVHLGRRLVGLRAS